MIDGLPRDENMMPIDRFLEEIHIHFDRVDEMIAKLDKNKDGLISIKELQAGIQKCVCTRSRECACVLA